jgi:hypothetical protein
MTPRLRQYAPGLLRGRLASLEGRAGWRAQLRARFVERSSPPDPSVQAMQGGQGAFYTSNEWVIDVGLDRLA